jgi:hypothetical protein
VDDTTLVQLAKAFRRPNRDYYPLGKFRVHLQTAHEVNDKFFIIPDWNN